jgi:hypothetical protein
VTVGAAALPMRRALAPASVVAGWLLAATALDLIVTRLGSRLMIFVPKDPALAGPASAVGRLAAFADALVPVVGLVLLVALIAGAASAGVAHRLALAGTAGVAVAGVLAIAVSPSTWFGAGTDLLVIGALVGFAAQLVRGERRLSSLRAAALALAGAAGFAALARLVEALGALAPGGGVPFVETGLRTAGEILFVFGAAAAGWAGLRPARRAGIVPRWAVGAGVVVAALLLVATAFAPSMADMILTWSLGLSGALPAAFYAAAAGLVVAGLPSLAATRREAAIGLGIVILAGNALSASGLLLAGLLGIAVAARGAHD